MAIRILVRRAMTTTLLAGAIGPLAAVGQAPATPAVSRFVGTWVGDLKANDEPWQAGLIPMYFGLKISTVGDSLVVAQLFKRPPVAPSDPWIQGTTVSYRFEGSPSSGRFNERAVTTKMAMEGDIMALTVLLTPGRAGGAGAGPPPPLPPAGKVLQAQRMSVDGDRLKVEWTEGPFPMTLYFDREKPPSDRVIDSVR